jgi:hypothetical protein
MNVIIGVSSSPPQPALPNNPSETTHATTPKLPNDRMSALSLAPRAGAAPQDADADS